MSDLLEGIEAKYPKTVTACHAEIRRLMDMISEADGQLDVKDSEIAELQSELDDIEEKETVEYEDVAGAVNSLLDECERIGPLRYEVRQSDRAYRAIVALHDAVGRNP